MYIVVKVLLKVKEEIEKTNFEKVNVPCAKRICYVSDKNRRFILFISFFEFESTGCVSLLRVMESEKTFPS